MESPAALPAASPSDETRGRAAARLLGLAFAGAALGCLLGIGTLELTRGLYPIIGQDVMVYICMAAGALMMPFRTRPLLLIALGICGLCIFLLSVSPFTAPTVWKFVRRDEPRAAPAVVVLASNTTRGGELAGVAQERVVRGYELVTRGFAPRLVLTSTPPPFRAWSDAVSLQVERLGLKAEVEVVGPARNTYEEAVAVAKLARERGWSEVLLVTHPVHMRRAELVFRKQGLTPICVPCAEGRYDLDELAKGSSRREAFRDWLHEVVGIWAYRRRGWI